MMSICSGMAGEEPNLLPNGNFAGKEPLAGWLTSFPDEGFYKDNAAYVKMAPSNEVGGRRAIVMELPEGIAGNQGGKIESVPIPVEPGAKYRIEVDCMTWNFSAKIHAEAWVPDPQPDQRRTIFRRVPASGRPALIVCFRAQVPSPPEKAKTWSTASREFIVPKSVEVKGEDEKPAYISIKVVTYGATMAAGKSYFSNFKLVRLAPEETATGPNSKP